MSPPELESSDTTIVDDGDIILVLPKQHRIRVSSIFLSYASPVFKTLFGPHFAEGQAARSPQHPKEIPLPDDDGAAVKHLCHLLHGQSEDSNGNPDKEFAERLWKLAVVADKYDCVGTLSLHTEAMLSRFLNRTATGALDIGAMAHLAAAASLLIQPRLFYVFTKRLVLDYHEPFLMLLSGPCSGTLSAEFLRTCSLTDQASLWLHDTNRPCAVTIETQRTTARLMFMEGMQHNTWCRGCGGYRVKGGDCAQMVVRKFSEYELGACLPRLSDRSLSEVLLHVHGMGDVVCNRLHAMEHTPGIPAAVFTNMAQKAYDAAGLCLQCTKNGGVATDSCEHEKDKVAAGPIASG